MGVDPGLARTGYGVVESSGGRLVVLAAGTVRAHPGEPPERQLLALCHALEEVISGLRPDALAVERLFFNSNARTAIRVCQASGVALLAAAARDVPVFEYTPTEVKLAVVGVGNATKDQVGYMVQRILRLDAAPDSPDAADALALGICHAHGHRLRAAGVAR